jgi:hypothetical protein
MAVKRIHHITASRLIHPNSKLLLRKLNRLTDDSDIGDGRDLCRMAYMSFHYTITMTSGVASQFSIHTQSFDKSSLQTLCTNTQKPPNHKVRIFGSIPPPIPSSPNQPVPSHPYTDRYLRKPQPRGFEMHVRIRADVNTYKQKKNKLQICRKSGYKTWFPVQAKHVPCWDRNEGRNGNVMACLYACMQEMRYADAARV